MVIESIDSPVYGVIYNKFHERWVANSTKLDIKMEICTVKKYGFNKAKLIACQIV